MKYVTVANTKVQVLEYNGERVMTTTQINKVFDNKKLVINYKTLVEKRLIEPSYVLNGDELTAYVTANECPLTKGGRGMKLWRQDAVSLFALYSKNENADAIMQELYEKYFTKPKTTQPVELPESVKAIAPIKSERSIEQTIIFNDGKVDGRSLYEFLRIETPYHIWFPRMCEYGFVEGTDFCTKMYESTGGRPAVNHDLTMDMAKEISMIQRNERGKQARQYFIECEKKLKAQVQKPMTQAELIAMQANALVEYEREQAKLKEDVRQIKEQSEHSTRILQSRIDTLNGVCTEGTPRQKLKAMVDLYAIKNGLQFGTAWREFVTAYNTAYKTNLKRKMKNYMRAHGIKKMTTPEYLEAVGKLDDAMRVADKMLNPKTNVFSF